MACFGTIPAKVLVIMVAALLYATKITADDSAITPSPLLETGAAFALPVMYGYLPKIYKEFYKLVSDGGPI
ncbi:unnamed protein product [Malus baccata var. baccata]